MRERERGLEDDGRPATACLVHVLDAIFEVS